MKLTAESTVINDNKLNTNIDNAQTTADGARVIADEAKQIADDTAQFFWFTSSGDDTGAHISEKTKAEFETAPSGGNLLARSNGIAVRDGLQELANFSESGIVVGDFFDVTSNGGEISHTDYTEKGISAVGTMTIDLSTDASFASQWATIASGGAFVIRVGYIFENSLGRTRRLTREVSFVKGTSSSDTYVTYTGINSITLTSSHPSTTFGEYQYKDSVALGIVITSATPLYRFGQDVADEGGAYGFLTGHGTKTGGDYQIVGGEFNAETSDAYFVIGKGTSDTNRSNAFVVGKDGSLYCQGHTEAIGLRRTYNLSSAVTLQPNTSTNLLSASLSRGTWVLQGQVQFAVNAIGLREIAISPNSEDTTAETMNQYAGEQIAATGNVIIMNITLIAETYATNTYYLCAYHTSSSAVNVTRASLKTVRIA